MRPELYRLLKVARQARTPVKLGSSPSTGGGLAQTLQAANKGPSPSRTHQAKALMRRLSTAPGPISTGDGSYGPPQTEAESYPSHTVPPMAGPIPAPETPPPPAAVEPPRTWHDAYQRRRAALRRQVRKGDMSTWQAQKNMQHWRETNLPGQNDQPLGVPGGSTRPTTQGFKYMLRQMAPTNTNAQNLREIRKAYNTATPQMRQTMFNNAQAAWRAGYTGPALTLEQLQSSSGFQS